MILATPSEAVAALVRLDRGDSHKSHKGSIRAVSCDLVDRPYSSCEYDPLNHTKTYERATAILFLTARLVDWNIHFLRQAFNTQDQTLRTLNRFVLWRLKKEKTLPATIRGR